ncbi:MAG: Crp/Fnr family transcriptional regulator [Geminicoccaceae bacterium]|nr:MAG: Crp/Fnr family transcriptional regulator [Geminicoccaceae bacterium]
MHGSQDAAADRRSPLALKLAAFVRLKAEELAQLERLQRRCRRFDAGAELLHETEVGAKAFILEEGWAVSYKSLADGGRQVVDFQIPGDFLGLRSLLLRMSDHSVAAVTEIVACEIDAAELQNALATAPRLGMALLWAVSRDEAMVVEHLVGIGRRAPLARAAHFFVELHQRLQLAQLATATSYACPLNQYLLADALGLTAIHLNRTLRRLRERGLMTLKAGTVTIHDVAGLTALAEFESGYLDQAPPSV